METIYIISQILVVLQCLFLMLTYQAKTNKEILILNTFAGIFAMLSFLFLNAIPGCLMSLLSIFRNYLFYKYKDSINVLFLIIVLLFVFTIFTFNDIFSLAPSIGTLLYTLSVWQRNIKTYKKIGLLIEISWIIYNLYVKSIFGVILESILLISAIVGIIRTKNHNNKEACYV